MKTVLFLAVIGVCFLILAVEHSEGAKRGGGRKRGKLRKDSSRLMIFSPQSKRKDYYDNPNGAQITKASHFDYEFILGHKIVFLCSAKGEPRPRITWFKDGTELYTHPFMQITEWHTGENQIKSKLEITPARQMDSGMYDCEANNKYAVDRRTFKADFSTISK